MCVCGCKHVCHGTCGGQMIAFFGESVLPCYAGQHTIFRQKSGLQDFVADAFAHQAILPLSCLTLLHLNIHFPNSVCEGVYLLPLNILVHLLKSNDSVYTDFFLDTVLSIGPFVYPMMAVLCQLQHHSKIKASDYSFYILFQEFYDLFLNFALLYIEFLYGARF